MPLMRHGLITLKFNHLTHLRWTKIRQEREGIICNKHELCKKESSSADAEVTQARQRNLGKIGHRVRRNNTLYKWANMMAKMNVNREGNKSGRMIPPSLTLMLMTESTTELARITRPVKNPSEQGRV